MCIEFVVFGFARLTVKTTFLSDRVLVEQQAAFYPVQRQPDAQSEDVNSAFAQQKPCLHTITCTWLKPKRLKSFAELFQPVTLRRPVVGGALQIFAGRFTVLAAQIPALQAADQHAPVAFSQAIPVIGAPRMS